ncbi:MAG: DEAD/DEAH box helicase, partial [Gammaproteobacteria bacterium]
MSATAMRPGSALGPYPERENLRLGALDRAVAKLSAAWMASGRGAAAGFRRLLPELEARSRRFENSREDELEAERQALREALGRRGLHRDLVARAFALIRERAGRSLGMRHFEVQCLGGWVMLNGMLAEMQTGQGKTLTATLPACTAGLAGIPVHVVTANEYLARRDAEQMEPLYRCLGLSVGVATQDMSSEARRSAYACHVTYCTGQQVAFDYLQDRLVRSDQGGRIRLALDRVHDSRAAANRLLMRGLCFAIVDEADSVLIDEARTPLILSRRVAGGEEARLFGEALVLAQPLEPGRDFHVRRDTRSIELTGQGERQLETGGTRLGGIWSGPRRRRELVNQALSALHLYVRDEDYLVRDGRVQIIDANTGRVMPDRTWERGLHQMIESKEGCDPSGGKETLARTTYQRFFRRYLRLAGMSGTVREVAAEMWTTYGLRVVDVPTHRPVQRMARRHRVYGTVRAKCDAILASVRELERRGRPVLIGTRTVADSAALSELLTAADLGHAVLSAHQDESEAAVVAKAGDAGRVTVATNMAGRGTDIALGPGVAEVGGLHVLVAERNDARRIDRQLIGRCARQGDPGSFEVIV